MFLFKRKENIMTKKSKMDRGLDSLFFDNSIDEISEADSSAVENDGGENGISTVRISLIEPDKKQPRSEFEYRQFSQYFHLGLFPAFPHLGAEAYCGFLAVSYEKEDKNG